LTIHSLFYFVINYIIINALVEFEPRVALNGKVEIYHQTILDAMKTTLFRNLVRSLVRYQSMPRGDWLMHKKEDGSGNSSDPAQIILLTVAVNYVEEVEQVLLNTIGKGTQYHREPLPLVIVHSYYSSYGR